MATTSTFNALVRCSKGMSYRVIDIELQMIYGKGQQKFFLLLFLLSTDLQCKGISCKESRL